jgi:hypothetical protein
MKAIWKTFTFILEIIAGIMISTFAVLFVCDILSFIVRDNSYLYSIVQIIYSIALLVAWTIVVVYIVRKRSRKRVFVPLTPQEKHVIYAKRYKPKRNIMRLILKMFLVCTGIFLINFRSATRNKCG